MESTSTLTTLKPLCKCAITDKQVSSVFLPSPSAFHVGNELTPEAALRQTCSTQLNSEASITSVQISQIQICHCKPLACSKLLCVMSPTLNTDFLSTCTKAEKKDALSVEKWRTGRPTTGLEAAQAEVVEAEQAAVGSAYLEKVEEWDA